jgi:hypothetical protein
VGPEGRASVNLTAPAVAQTYPAVGITANPTTGIPSPVERKVWEENYKLLESPTPKYAPTLIKLHHLATLTPP